LAPSDRESGAIERPDRPARGSLLSARSDEELADRMFRGEEEAARELIERLRRPLFGTLLRLTRNRADAEELFQEAFTRALGASARFDSSRRFKPWIFAIAVNLARDRNKRASHPAAPELRAPSELPECQAQTHEARLIARADIHRALEALSDPHREIVELRYFEGLEEPEIARAAGIPRGTVKSRLHHALRTLRDLMKAETS